MTTDIPLSLDPRAFPVLYVDDEEANLRTFELAFRREFTVVKASSGAEALEILAEQPIAVVLSDHRMPGMTGTELLARVRQLAPDTIRLLVTAYGDANTLAEAINDGSIYRYVPKPWEPAEMREIVRQAIELHALESERRNLVSKLTTLHRTSQKISSQLETGALTDLILRTLVEDLGCDAATLLAYRRERGELVWQKGLPPVEESEHGAVVLSREKSRDVFAALDAGRPIVLDLDRAFDLGAELRGLVTELAAEEILILPLAGRYELLGALLVDNRRGGTRFSRAGRQLLEGIGAQASIALDNARLVAELHADAAGGRTRGGLRVGAALAPSLIRELLRPLQESEHGERGAEWARAARKRVELFGEMLADEDVTYCDLGERVQAACSLLADHAGERDIVVEVRTSGPLPKLEALSGRLLQLVMHMLELVIDGSESGGRVEATVGGDARALSLEVASSDATSFPGEEGMELKLSACEALAGELGGSMQVSAGRTQCEWCQPLLVSRG